MKKPYAPIRVSPSTFSKVVEVKADLMKKNGKNKSMDDAIDAMYEAWKELRKRR